LTREKRDRGIAELGGWSGKKKEVAVDGLKEEYFHEQSLMTVMYEETDSEAAAVVGMYDTSEEN